MKRSSIAAACVALMALASAANAQSVTFQNGVDGYSGTFDMRISSSGHVYFGPQVTQYQFDGRQSDGSEVDRYGLIRFDDIFGTQPGRIRPGATILSARLEFTTCTEADASAAESGGPIGVARLLKPFDENTRWSSYGTSGPTFAGGDYDRPAGGYGAVRFGQSHGADVTSIVQAWSAGEPNHGFMIVCSTTDAWYIYTTGHPTPSLRPRLVVEYTTLKTRAVTFRQGVNGYNQCAMILLNQNGTSTFGDTLNSAYIDGYVAGPPMEPAIEALIKFDALFGEGPDQLSTGQTIVKAYLTLTTPPKSESFQTRSNGPYHIHRLLVDCDWQGNDWSKPLLWSDFINEDGPTEADNEIGPVLSSVQGMAWDATAWFDVTDAVKAWRDGQPNLGLNVKPGTSDGWKIYWTGASDLTVRPQLVVLVPSKGADLDLDGDVDLDDLMLFEECASGPSVPLAPGCDHADFDGDFDVDQDDFAIFQRCFSGTNPATQECR